MQLKLDSLISCVAERFSSVAPPTRKRKRTAEIDRYIDHLCAFTLRRVRAAPQDKRKFSLQRLADELSEKHGRNFDRSTVMRALQRHKIYDLW